jgi:hypothetical protein
LQRHYCRLFLDNSLDWFIGADEEAKMAKRSKEGKKGLLPSLLLFAIFASLLALAPGKLRGKYSARILQWPWRSGLNNGEIRNAVRRGSEHMPSEIWHIANACDVRGHQVSLRHSLSSPVRFASRLKRGVNRKDLNNAY